MRKMTVTPKSCRLIYWGLQLLHDLKSSSRISARTLMYTFVVLPLGNFKEDSLPNLPILDVPFTARSPLLLIPTQTSSLLATPPDPSTVTLGDNPLRGSMCLTSEEPRPSRCRTLYHASLG